MRKIVTILLVCLLLFNCGGYHMLFYWLQQQTSLALEARLDKDEYCEPDLLEITIPLNMPYLSDWSDFQPAEGEIVIRGVLYHFVKQKVANNQLIIKCIPNYNKSRLAKSEDNYFKLINDLQNKPENKANSIGKASLNYHEYNEHPFFSFYIHNHFLTNISFPPAASRFLSMAAYNAPAQPPEISVG